MPYLSFDLDAKKKAAICAEYAGVPPGVVAWGLLELWEYAWKEKADTVAEMFMTVFFGSNERLREALVSLGFVEKSGDKWRVRGADRYLRIVEAKSDAGKNRVAGAKRDAKGRLTSSSPAPIQQASSTHPAPAGQPTSSQPALSSSIEHRASKDLKTLRAKGSPPAEEPATPEWQTLVAGLYTIFRTHKGQDPSPTGKDWKKLKELRERVKTNDAEILKRWDRGLRSGFKERVDSFADLFERWDSLVGADPPTRAGNARFVQAQDVDKAALAKTGTFDDF